MYLLIGIILLAVVCKSALHVSGKIGMVLGGCVGLALSILMIMLGNYSIGGFMFLFTYSIVTGSLLVGLMSLLSESFWALGVGVFVFLNLLIFAPLLTALLFVPVK